MINTPLFLFVGRSASGKTTIADMLEQNYGHKQVWSYATRPMRYDNEKYHTFISEDCFNKLENLVAYTEYNGFKYGTTAQQLDECSIYVVDVPGVETLLKNYKTDRPICIIYFDTTVHTRINRMLDRHDSDVTIISRLLQDEKDDWFRELDSLMWHYENIVGRNVRLHSVNANGSKTDVLESVLYYMNRYMED